MPIIWESRPEDVFAAGYSAYAQKIRVAIIVLLEAHRADIQEWMQQNASWKDRTGAARRGLYVDVSAMADSIVATLGYSVPYGIFLETKNTGRYAILTPAIDYWTPIIIQELQGILSS